MKLSNEDELIFSCSCRVLSEPAIKKVRKILSGPVDWQYFLDASSYHGVFPLAFEQLSTVGSDTIPEDILSGFRKQYQTNVARNLIFTNLLLSLVSCLKQEGIKAVPFKGPLLAQDLYGDIGLRTFCDLDILIDSNDAVKVFKVLSDQGHKPALVLSPSQMMQYMKFEDDLQFIHRETGVLIEVHWEMSGNYLASSMDMEFVEEGLQKTILLQYEIKSLSYEDLLIYLCVHASKHMWARLEWGVSVAELLKGKHNLEWNVILKKINTLRCRRMVLFSLYSVRELFQITLPDRINDLLAAESQMPKLHEKLINTLFPLYNETRAESIGARFNLFQLQLRDSWFDGIKYGFRELFEPKEADWHWIALPAPLTFIYIFLRPLRQFMKMLSARF